MPCAVGSGASQSRDILFSDIRAVGQEGKNVKLQTFAIKDVFLKKWEFNYMGKVE